MGENSRVGNPLAWTELSSACVPTCVPLPGCCFGASPVGEVTKINLLFAFHPWFCGCSCVLPVLPPRVIRTTPAGTSYTLCSRETGQPCSLAASEVQRSISLLSSQQSTPLGSAAGRRHLLISKVVSHFQNRKSKRSEWPGSSPRWRTKLAALRCQPAVPPLKGTCMSGGSSALLGGGQSLFRLDSSGVCPVTKCAVTLEAETPVLFNAVALSKQSTLEQPVGFLLQAKRASKNPSCDSHFLLEINEEIWGKK